MIFTRINEQVLQVLITWEYCSLNLNAINKLSAFARRPNCLEYHSCPLTKKDLWARVGVVVEGSQSGKAAICWLSEETPRTAENVELCHRQLPWTSLHQQLVQEKVTSPHHLCRGTKDSPDATWPDAWSMLVLGTSLAQNNAPFAAGCDCHLHHGSRKQFCKGSPAEPLATCCA